MGTPNTIIPLDSSAKVRITLDLKRIFETFVQATIGYLNQQAATAEAFAKQKAPVRKIFYGGARANRLRPSFRHTVTGSNGTLMSHRHAADFRRIKVTRDRNTGEDIVSMESTRAERELNFRGHLELRRANASFFGGEGNRRPNTPLSQEEREELHEQYARYQADQALPASIRRGVERPGLSGPVGLGRHIETGKVVLVGGTGIRGKNASAVYQGRLGGRLRGEIYFVPARPSGGDLLKAWIISPTPYARYVEFGTRRSRKQPYMRPALYHVRQNFRDGLRAALGRSGRRRA